MKLKIPGLPQLVQYAFDILLNKGIGLDNLSDDISKKILSNSADITNSICFIDNRSVDDLPSELPSRKLTCYFKYKKSAGNPPVDSGNQYVWILNVLGWNSHEGSGGWPVQIAIGKEGLAYRQAIDASTWGSWTKISNISDISGLAKTSGDTFTGQIQIQGTAASRPLVVRGISGSDGTTGTINDLYLNYDSNKPVVFGSNGVQIDPVAKTINANAATATKLKTARTINGIVFDGSANITTDISNTNGNLSTERLSEPEYIRGSITKTARPLFDVLRADRTAFLPASQIIIEESTDGGVTWRDAQVSDSTKTKLFTGQRPSIRIPLKNGVKSTDCMLRITITGMKYDVPAGTSETAKYNYWNSSYVKSTERYFRAQEGWAWVNSNSDRIYMKVERATGANPNGWATDREAYMSGWSGGNYFRLSGSTFGGSTSQTGNTWNWRFTFRTCSPKLTFNDTDLATTYTTSNQSIYHIKICGEGVWAYSNNYMYHDHLYKWDENQNAIFPAGISAKTVNSDADVGTIKAYAGSLPPSGYLECNGQAVSRTTYADLYRVISTKWGAGNGSTTFNLPDFRGEFLRGWDNGRGVDSGRGFGSSQASDVEPHSHTYSVPVKGSAVNTGMGGSSGVRNSWTTGTTNSSAGTETRPRNKAVMYIIKY
jgi:microcystin-dependent protein